MAIQMGPVLSFRGWDAKNQTWRISILIVADANPPAFSWRAAGGKKTRQASAQALWSLNGKTVYRHEIAVPLQEKPSTFQYAFDDAAYEVALPARGRIPRLAYASCNGFSALKLMKTVNDKNSMWKEMAARHESQPLHLLLLGGDQVYADSMWETVESMKRWNELGFEKGNAAPFTMQAELEAFYFDLYVERWSQPEVARMLATVPTIMMWDDHDIIDGWGSYPDARQNCPVFKGMWPVARKAFAVFQRHLPADAASGGMAPEACFTEGYILPNLAILALDMRSERTDAQVLSLTHWAKVYQWLDALLKLDHLFVMASIPVVYPDFGAVESVLGIFPGQQELEDDLRDHWNSRPHKGERLRLIHRLLDFSESRQIRPTIISGDVHVAAVGVVESTRSGIGGKATEVINQLISSAIVHPAPPAMMLFALRHLFSNKEEADRGVIARMIDFPGTQFGFIGKRNFLTLDGDEAEQGNRIWANWHIEGERDPFVKVIHAIR
jgi:hypothetical protein